MPEVVVDDVSQKNAEGLLRDVFDMMWNAGGWAASPHYGADGRWSCLARAVTAPICCATIKWFWNVRSPWPRIREGIAWVGVSAQFVGVEGGPSIIGLPPMPLTIVDPARYGSLVHPGDSFSYDIFSQAGQAIRQPSGPSPLGDLRIEAVIAAGESQSAFRMVTYVDAIHPMAGVYDGFLVHSRGTASQATIGNRLRTAGPSSNPIAQLARRPTQR